MLYREVIMNIPYPHFSSFSIFPNKFLYYITGTFMRKIGPTEELINKFLFLRNKGGESPIDESHCLRK